MSCPIRPISDRRDPAVAGNSSDPFDGGSSVDISLSSVVFPHPFGPMMSNRSLGPTSRSTRATAQRGPQRRPSPVARRAASIVAEPNTPPEGPRRRGGAGAPESDDSAVSSYRIDSPAGFFRRDLVTSRGGSRDAERSCAHPDRANFRAIDRTKNVRQSLKSKKTLTDTLTCQRISVMMSLG